MTQIEIIKLAHEAGLHVATDLNWMPIIGIQYAEKFANLIAEHERERLTDAAMKAAVKAVDVAIALEREACAKLCEAMNKYMDDGEECAAAIRARGQA